MVNQSTFRNAFKALSLFGSVQIVSVITGLLRAKAAAIFLGPTGFGISSLLNSSVTIIGTISGLGLNYSAVRDISLANETGDLKKISVTLKIFRRWLWISGLFGALLLIIFSRLISKYTFGNEEYIYSYALLSIMMLFVTLSNGNTALLQGLRKVEFTAKSMLIGSIAGLLISVPLYYYFRIKGIVPGFIFGSMISYFSSLYFTKKVKVEPVNVSKKQTILTGINMSKLGLTMVAAQIIGNITIYLINTFIRKTGGIADVGFYQAGTSIVNQGVGLVYAAMGADYFSRLSAVSSDKTRMKIVIDQQAIMTILLATPILIGIIIFSPFIIKILLSPEFYIITDFIKWLAFGSIFTAPIVVVGYIALAKGDKKNYFLYGSLYNNILSVIFYISGYALYGLKGMAIAFLIFQLVYGLFMVLKYKQLYSYFFCRQFLKIYTVLLILATGTLFSTSLLEKKIGYISATFFLILAIIYSIKKLDEYLELRKYIINKISATKNKKTALLEEKTDV